MKDVAPGGKLKVSRTFTSRTKEQRHEPLFTTTGQACLGDDLWLGSVAFTRHADAHLSSRRLEQFFPRQRQAFRAVQGVRHFLQPAIEKGGGGGRRASGPAGDVSAYAEDQQGRGGPAVRQG